MAKLTAEEEVDLARRILDAEARTEAALQGMAVADDILDESPRRKERTRAGKVQRLERAVEAAWEAAKEDPSLRESARAAKMAWKEAEDLSWTLAMSGRRIAHGEARKLAGPFLAEPDLVQEGYIGLLNAARRFEPDRNIRFSTYAKWWVRAQMTRAIDHTGRPVRLPGCAVEQLRNLRKAMKGLDTQGIEYTTNMLAEEVGLEEERVQFLLSRGTTVSLEEPVEDGRKARQVGHFLADEDADGADELLVHEQELARMLRGLTDVLPERHRIVIEQRYGLDGKPQRTLSEVGRRISLSRERVRQLERDALRLLRESGRIREVAA
ncbi:MAG: sigma-70 family RNA polymerase sigma factor [Alphaproteobacteria bacterium]|nr:sigma-70 family RNA polymerase sigma factor [Alphaproteobacteria bacterium]MCB9693998.1 sigma-70 family RNA polymerase sigma factor [Alphaproteobacteria bacterium]